MKKILLKTSFNQKIFNFDREFENMPDITILSGEDFSIADFVICDKEYLLKLDEKKIRSLPSHKIICLTVDSDEENVLNLLSKFNINYMVGLNSGHEVDEILSIIRGAVLQLKHKTSFDINISNSEHLDKSIDMIVSKLDTCDFFNSSSDSVRLILNELMTNAIFNAQDRSDADRTLDFDLEGAEIISIKTFKDEEKLSLTVVDNFGKLSKQQIVKTLERCYREKTFERKKGGAGLGLYLVFNHSNQLIIKVEKNKKTVITSIIEKNKRFKKYKERVTSFHYVEA